MDSKTYQPLTFSKQQFALINSIIDCLIPSSTEMPSASEVQVAEYIDSFSNDSPKLRKTFLEGLQNIENASHNLASKSFVTLEINSKHKILEKTEEQNTNFFSELVRQTYNGYYTTPKVLRQIGTEGRPPQPLGYNLEQGDLELLEKVRGRGKIWRDI